MDFLKKLIVGILGLFGLSTILSAKKSKEVEELGAGEIMVTSIDKEGTGKGPDIKLVEKIQNTSKLPVIYSGGIGNLEDVKSLVKEALS